MPLQDGFCNWQALTGAQKQLCLPGLAPSHCQIEDGARPGVQNCAWACHSPVRELTIAEYTMQELLKSLQDLPVPSSNPEPGRSHVKGEGADFLLAEAADTLKAMQACIPA